MSKRRPGKFEGAPDHDVGEKLYEMVGDGMLDDEAGDVGTTGWFGLLTDTGIRGARHVIVNEDSNGFFDYDVFQSAAKARAKFEEIADEIAELESEGEYE